MVCIRQKEPLTKLQKGWTSQCFAVEDPVELSHNLVEAVGLKSKPLFGQYDKALYLLTFSESLCQAVVCKIEKSVWQTIGGVTCTSS